MWSLNKKLTKRAQELRTRATEQENRLWYSFFYVPTRFSFGDK